MTIRLSLLLVLIYYVQSIPLDVPKAILNRFNELSIKTDWVLDKKIKLNFDLFHPQGMVKINDRYFMSTVNVTGVLVGKGYMLEFDENGVQLSRNLLAEGHVFHPGGIDYDGRYIWVPVAEYRPDSSAHILRFDPESYEVTTVFKFNDHIGALTFNVYDQTLHGYSWGAARFYTWKMEKQFEFYQISDQVQFQRQQNPASYIAYQDCHYIPKKYALCNGLNTYQNPFVEGKIGIGGVELVDLQSGIILKSVPVPLYIPITINPFWYEINELGGLKFYFVPEDQDGNLWSYNVFTLSNSDEQQQINDL